MPKLGGFLEDPRSIRKAVEWLAREADRLDLAVAFVGQDWRHAIAGFRGHLRVICWLTSTNTNPRAVREMMNRPRTAVRQRDAMHAKVYYAPGVGAVVGSANLSRRALADADVSGQDEAGVLLTSPKSLREIGQWFNRLWPDAELIGPKDLAAAVKAYDKARAAKRSRGGGGGGRPQETARHALGTGRRKMNLLRLARRVRRLNLRPGAVARVNPRQATRRDLENIAAVLTDWTRRPFLAQRALLARRLAVVRRALTTLFDGAPETIEERLAEVIDSGALAPLDISSLSVLLHFRAPTTYVPYNWRTIQFLRDYRLHERGRSNASPAAYARWLEQAERLRRELRLPSRGHVDRMVWEHTAPN
jgi:hypothetical protein